MADVVVVGGGSAGSVVAARLSEDAGRSVVLVESGPGYTSLNSCPVRDATVLEVGPESPWATHYSVELAKGRSAVVSRGRILGGSGAVNGGYFVRAREEDFAAWPASWSYTDVLPYFVRSEHDLDFSGPEHGDAGPIPIARRAVAEFSEITSAFFAAATEAGHSVERDKNGQEPSGVGPVPLNISGTTRMSTALSYRIPALHHSNLEVLSDSAVSRVIFSGGRASGVEVIRDGELSIVRADCVVLAAGAIETPLLLMRSGVGGSKDLSYQGITVLVDLPGVGRSATDHPEILVPIRMSEERAGGARHPALEVTLNTDDVEMRPYTASFSRLIPGSLADGQYVGVGLMRTESRGNIRMVSPDPGDAPRIEYHYLESETDKRRLRRGLAETKRILESTSMRRIAEIPAIEETDAWMLGQLATSQHLSSTCRMGDDTDPGAVVDERCRVRGVDGLYIADSSAMPCVPSRGPHATTVMLAERVADFVRAD